LLQDLYQRRRQAGAAVGDDQAELLAFQSALGIAEKATRSATETFPRLHATVGT
jgi:hypothetical protein